MKSGPESPSFVRRLRNLVVAFKRELRVYRLVVADPRTPKPAKVLLGIAIGYVLLPFDLIPDFIPVLGYLDEIVIVPLLVFLALKLVPPEIVEECRQRSNENEITD